MIKNTEEQLKKLQNTHMTDAERTLIRTNLISFMEDVSPSRYQKIVSPFMSFWSPVLVTMASVVFVLLGGSAIAYHASNSLPGDSLFAWKVNVNERVAGMLTKSKSAKFKNEQFLVAQRLKEVKTLVEKGELTKEKAEIAEKNIDTHIEKIAEGAKDLAETDPKEFIELSKGLDTIIDDHKKDLSDMKEVREAGAEIFLQKAALSTDPALVKEATGTAASIENKKEETAPTKDAITKVEESKVVDNIISKVEKEAGNLKEIAQSVIAENKEVKDTTVKTEVQKEIVPETSAVTQ